MCDECEKPELKHKYIKRTGTSGNYKYTYPEDLKRKQNNISINEVTDESHREVVNRQYSALKQSAEMSEKRVASLEKQLELLRKIEQPNSNDWDEIHKTEDKLKEVKQHLKKLRDWLDKQKKPNQATKKEIENTTKKYAQQIDPKEQGVCFAVAKNLGEYFEKQGHDVKAVYGFRNIGNNKIGPHFWLEVDGLVVDGTNGLVTEKKNAKDYYKGNTEDYEYTKPSELKHEDYDWGDNPDNEVYKIRKNPETKGIVTDIANKIYKVFNLDRFKTLINRYLVERYNQGIEQIENQLQINVDFNTNARNTSILNQYAFDNIKQITEEIQNKLRQELQRGILQNDTQDQLRQRVTDIFQGNNPTRFSYETRMRMITRTEGKRAINMAKFQGAIESGRELYKYLRIIEDDRTSAICKKEHAKYGTKEQAIPLREPFKVTVAGKTYTEQYPPFHVNCRTTLVITQTPQEEE